MLVASAGVITLTLVAELWLLRGGPGEGWPVGGAVACVAMLALLGTALIAVAIVWLWERPLRDVIRTARSLSRGDLSARAEAFSADEMGLLARTLNRMRDHLVGQVEAVDRERRTIATLLDELAEGVVVASADGKVALMNPAARRLLNLSPVRGGDYVGLAVERCIPQHDLQRMLLATAARDGQAGDTAASVPREARLQIDGPGGVLHLLAQAADIRLPGAGERGGSAGRLLVITDISALTRMVQMRTDFVANASHELRTPVTTIRAAIETLQKMDLAGDTESARRFLDAIDRQSGRLEEMASDLLDLARLETGTGQFAPQPVSLTGLLRELETQFKERVRAKELTWTVDRRACARDELMVNPLLIRLALDNLIDNAVKFTEAGGRITLALADDGRGMSIEVADDGCGIPLEEQERVFERFYQVGRARSGQQRGTGLGLSIVRHAVAAMGGQVKLDSAPGAGTRVRVTIPRPE
jgi:two-component system phosphate regulon sensor histidine kinase PhoR